MSWQKSYDARRQKDPAYRARKAAYHRKWAQTETGKRAKKRAMLKNRYDFSLEEHDAMLLAQGNKCKICLVPFDGNSLIHVDHCHTTNKVRGLLCFGCNTGLGSFKDDPVLVAAALLYLED